MLKKLNFRQKLFLYLTIIFTIFTALVLLFQYEREKDNKIIQLERSLDIVTELTQKYIENNKLNNTGNYQLLDSLNAIIPIPNIRITVISQKGNVLYDSGVSEYKKMENHINRPEIKKSIGSEYGANIRTSKTTNSSYYYYAKFYSDYYVRTATHYDVNVKNFLQVEIFFILYLVALFILLVVALYFFTKRLSKTITKLKDFAVKLGDGQEIATNIDFPNDELGVISKQIIDIYNKLNKAKNKTKVANDKLFGHLQALNEGIAFFTPKKEKILTNNHFVSFINIISDESTISAEKIFEINQFSPISSFIEKQLSSNIKIDSNNPPFFENSIFNNERYFNIQCIFFQDKSFEIIIKDTTKLEKRNLIKQQMTSNISHELKTPVSSVIGYLETLQNNNVEPEKRKRFIDKAFAQAMRLSSLIEDMSTLNKIEETKEHFQFEPLKINSIVKEVKDDFKIKLNQKNINVIIEISNEIEINGNYSLLSSVFYNLFDNAIKYGGENFEISVNNYLDDKEYYYFSFSNTGNGIGKTHFTRIFERFYRVDNGRSRNTGGTGLGLAIVKNAIQFHNGEITARESKGGGLEFLITIGKGLLINNIRY